MRSHSALTGECVIGTVSVTYYLRRPIITTTPNLKTMFVRLDMLPHGWQVLAVLLLGGAVATGSYGLAQLGWLDVAATLLTAWVLAFGRLIFAGRKPREGAAFAGTRGMLATAMDDARTFLATRAVLAKALIAVGSALGFVAARAVVSWGLGALSNPWLAGAAGLIVASFVASPVLWKAMAGSVGADTDSMPKDTSARD